MDKPQLGFGDLMSNWHAARFLRAANPNARINFYVSPGFHQRFRTAEPGFMTPESHPEVRVQIIAGIRVFSRSNDELYAGEQPTGNPTPEANHEIHTMLTTGTNERVCNLAFTALAPDVARYAQIPDLPQYGATSLGYKMLVRSVPLAQKPIPFLIVTYFTDTRPNRLMVDDTNNDMDTAGYVWKIGSVPPIFELRSSFANNALFITRRDDVFDLGRLSMGTDYLGFGYAASHAVIREYLSMVERMANALPDSRFAVVTAKSSQNVPIAVTEPLMLQQTHGEGSQIAGNPPQRRFLEYIVGEHRNLHIREYEGGLPFDDITRLIASSNLPVLVTGTMSLSQAVQQDKPFLYEVLSHHKWVASEIGKTLVSSQGRMDILIPYNAGVNIPFVEQNTFRQFTPATGIRRENYLFGRIDGHFNLQTYNQTYQTLSTRIRLYRTENGVTQPRGQLLDNIHQYCDRAINAYRKIRSTCWTKSRKNKPACIKPILQELNDQIAIQNPAQ